MRDQKRKKLLWWEERDKSRSLGSVEVAWNDDGLEGWVAIAPRLMKASREMIAR